MPYRSSPPLSKNRPQAFPHGATGRLPRRRAPRARVSRQATGQMTRSFPSAFPRLLRGLALETEVLPPPQAQAPRERSVSRFFRLVLWHSPSATKKYSATAEVTVLLRQKKRQSARLGREVLSLRRTRREGVYFPSEK